jgi:hypothetical protein
MGNQNLSVAKTMTATKVVTRKAPTTINTLV